MYCNIFVVILMVFGEWAALTKTHIHLPEPHSFIIRGNPALQKAHPYMAGLSKDYRHRKLFCGASVIGKRTVLTAAHCVDFAFFDGVLDDSLRVMVGSTLWISGCVMYEVSHNLTHPNYLPGPMKNDIALLITSTDISFNDTVSPVKLDFSFQDENIQAKVAGWGMTEKGYYSLTLMELTVTTITGEECIDKMLEISNTTVTALYAVDSDVEICTHQPPGHGTCMVDSGSPLVRTDTHKQIAIVSWGLPCAKGAPDVYVKISAYKDWIEDNIV